VWVLGGWGGCGPWVLALGLMDRLVAGVSLYAGCHEPTARVGPVGLVRFWHRAIRGHNRPYRAAADPDPESPAVSLRPKWDESLLWSAFTSVPFQEQLFDSRARAVMPDDSNICSTVGCEPRGTHTHASQPPLKNDTMNMVSIRAISNPRKGAPALPLGLSTTSRRRM